jgi:hypothetical protein
MMKLRYLLNINVLIEIDNQIRYIPYLLSIFNEKNITISNIHIP